MRRGAAALLASLVASGLPTARFPDDLARVGPFEKADVAWMLTATSLVMLVTPGLSFFHGGRVRGALDLSQHDEAIYDTALREPRDARESLPTTAEPA